MAVISLKFKASIGLSEELKATGNRINEKALNNALEKATSADAYTKNSQKHAHFWDLMRLGQSAKPGSKILDIGAGQGASTIYFASLGHEVSALEPSLEACQVVEAVSKKVGAKVSIYRGTAEVCDQISERFDHVVFNSSLHHCDDPLLALKNAKSLLLPGGKVHLVNEPILKIFRSKRWYYKRLKTHPLQMGHYGGNEHIYYYWEYKKMLKMAGLRHINTTPSHAITEPRKSLQLMIDHNLDGQAIYSDQKLWLHYGWNLFLSKMTRHPFFRNALERMSLLPVSLTGSPI